MLELKKRLSYSTGRKKKLTTVQTPPSKTTVILELRIVLGQDNRWPKVGAKLWRFLNVGELLQTDVRLRRVLRRT